MARRAATRRVIFDPAHPDFPHGTSPGYNRGCKCGPCLGADKRREAQRKVNRAAGLPAYVDSDMLRAHIEALHAVACNATIAEAAGVSRFTIESILDGRRVYPATAAKVLSVSTATVAGKRWYVDARKAHVQYHSLRRLGWSGPYLAERFGSPGQGAPPFVMRRQQRITARTAEKMQALYDELGATPGPSAKAARHAKRGGWQVPLAYDDDGNLIPDAVRPGLGRPRRRDTAETAA